jgi:hypothetical protein
VSSGSALQFIADSQGWAEKVFRLCTAVDCR